MDTYNEIKNYLIYEVFSNDEMAARLDDIRRQIKSFRVEHDELIYVIGNKKRKVLLSGGERQRAIQEAYSKKGWSYPFLGNKYFILSSCKLCEQ